MQDYLIIDRLYKRADDQPQRTIKLYYVPFDSNGIDLSEEQIQKFHDLASSEKGGRKNIEVIDLYSSFKDKHDFNFLKDKDTNFACKVDIARIMALIEDGPAIYFDFDVTPSKGRKLGEVSMNKHGFAMAKKILQDSLENSIIAVDSKDNYILRALYNAINTLSQNERYTGHDDIWRMQLQAVKQVYTAEQKGVLLTEDELKSKLMANISVEDMYNMKKIPDVDVSRIFMFRGPAHVGKDNSWNFDYISSVGVVNKENGVDSGCCNTERELFKMFNKATGCTEKLEGLKPDTKVDERISVDLHQVNEKSPGH
jgi:hypothetical protein